MNPLDFRSPSTHLLRQGVSEGLANQVIIFVGIRVVLISNLGHLNHAATIALSALLQLNGIPHRVLPEDAVAPGKFPVLDMSSVKFVCVCSLTAQSQAKINYVNKRLLANIGEARLLHVAWDGTAEKPELISPVSAVTVLTAQ